MLSMGSLLLMTVVPIVMYARRWSKTVRIALITIWILSAATVFIYTAVIFVLAD